MILSDEVWIANMKRLGYPDRIANDYYNMGCVEIMFGGRQPNLGRDGADRLPDAARAGLRADPRGHVLPGDV